MPKITYIESDGTSHSVEVPVGHSVMEGATKHNVPGIDADCGGACACATCHVYVDPSWVDLIGEISRAEMEMIEFARNVKYNSRLSCQIIVTNSMDGIVVTMPESQNF